MTELIALVNDDVRLKDERSKAKANRDKYKGVSNDDVAFGKSKYAAHLLESRLSLMAPCRYSSSYDSEPSCVYCGCMASALHHMSL